jgi:hypothetical protein
MPIRPATPPAASLQAVREAAQTTPKAYRHMAEMMQTVATDWKKHWPHPVYRVGLKEMTATNWLRKAEMIGWRYLVQTRNQRQYAIEVQMEADGTEHCFAELDKGPYVDGFYRVLHDDSLAKKTGATVFRPAVLRINALAIFAVWTKKC